jgi:O-methyltransferase
MAQPGSATEKGLGVGPEALAGSREAPRLYLSLLKGVLTRYVVGDEAHRPLTPSRPVKRAVTRLLLGSLSRAGLELVRKHPFDAAVRAEGRDWPPEAETMVGLRRLDNLQTCIEDVHFRRVPGDLIECGVWRGGAVILMRAVLRAYGITDRLVWAADSFSGFPSTGEGERAADSSDNLGVHRMLAVSLEEVKRNFERYGLLDEQVRFLSGWFRDTLPGATMPRLAVMRLDSDRYQSTRECLRSLYPKLSPGGYVIVDDYGAHPGSKTATDDFRREHSITEPLREIDWSGVYWKRAG